MIDFSKAIKDEFGVLQVIDELNKTHIAIPMDESNSDYKAYLRWLENPDAEEFTGGTL